MNEKKNKLKSRILNLTFFAVVLFFLISTPAKSWLLRQLIRTGIFSAKIEKAEPAKSNYSAMPLTFSKEDGSMQSTDNFRGKIVFINFWASWCPPCRAEMPSVNELYQKLKDNPDFEFVFVNLDDEISTAKKYLNDNKFEIPLQRPEGFIPTDFYTGTLPTTVVLDKAGTVVMKHSGMADYSSKKFITQLNALK